ncbi:MAG: glycosyltransferase family 9 protein, partial [Candidatus Taylorbacteria bacterium]
YNNFLHYRRNCSGVTGACMMVTKEKFLENGGFDENLSLVGNDFDFCLRLKEKGYFNLYVPEVKLIHHELVSRKGIPEYDDTRIMWDKYGSNFRAGDPYFNKNLNINEEGKIDLCWDLVSIGLYGAPSLTKTNIQKILLIKLDHIGDVILSIPAIRKIRTIFQNAEITVLCAPWAEDILKMQPEIDNLIIFRYFEEVSQHGVSSCYRTEYFDLIRNINDHMYDLVINMRRHEDCKSILEKINAPFVLSYSVLSEHEPFSHSLPSVKDIRQLNCRWNISDQLKNLVSVIEEDYGQNGGELVITSEIQNKAQALYNSLSPEAFKNKLIIGMHTQVGSHLRQWPAEYFSTLADRVAKAYNASILFFGSKNDIEPIEQIISNMANKNMALSLAGKFSIAETCSIIKKCNYFIGNNSGLIHLSSIQNVPTLGIYSGVVSTQEWAPLGKKSMIITKNLACSPCYFPSFSSCKYDYKCMKELYPEDVSNAFDRLKTIFPGTYMESNNSFNNSK